MPFNSEGMYRGFITDQGDITVRIYHDRWIAGCIHFQRRVFKRITAARAAPNWGGPNS